MKLKQKLYDLKNQRKGLLDEAKDILLKDGKTEAYTAKMDDVAKLNADIEATEALIAEEEKGMDPGEDPTAISLKGGAGSGAPESGLKKAIKALAEAARNGFKVAKAVTEGGMANTQYPADGGYMVPEDIETQVYALRGEVPSLLDEVTVKTVTAKKGRRTLRKRRKATGFATVAEAAAYPLLGTPQFETVEYDIEKRGGVTAATAEIMEYTDEEIADEVIDFLATESRATANRLILDEAKRAGTTAFAGLDDIIKAWIGLGSSFRAVSKLITNADGLAWLATLKDKNGRSLLNPNPSEPGKMQLSFGGQIIPVKDYDNDVIASDGTKAPFILGSLKDGIVYWQKKGFAIKQSDVAVVGDLNAYEQDLVLWRGSQWDDCTGWDDEAYVYGEVDTAAAAG